MVILPLIMMGVLQEGHDQQIHRAQRSGDEAALKRLMKLGKVDFGSNEFDAYSGLIYDDGDGRILGRSRDPEKLRRMIRIMKSGGYAMSRDVNQSGIIRRTYQQAAPLVRVWLDEGADPNRLVINVGTMVVQSMRTEDNWFQYQNPKREPRSAFYFEATPVYAEFTHPNDPATPQGAPPLNAAAFYGRTQVMEILRKRGAKLEGVNERNETALHAACMRDTEVNAQAVRLLLKWGANRNAKNVDGETPFALATRKRFSKIIAALQAN